MAAVARRLVRQGQEGSADPDAVMDVIAVAYATMMPGPVDASVTRYLAQRGDVKMAPNSVARGDAFTAQLDAVRFLDLVLVPCFSTHFARTPSPMVLHAILLCVNYRLHRQLSSVLPLLMKPVAFSEAKSAPLLKCLLGHIIALGVRSRTLWHAGIQAEFLSHLVARFDHRSLRDVLWPYLSEILLTPMLHADAASAAAAHPALLALVDHQFPRMRQLAANPDADQRHVLLAERFVAAFDTHARDVLRQQKQQQQQQGADETDGMQGTRSIYTRFFLATMQLVTDVTSAAASGRYLALLLVYRTPSHPLLWVDQAQRLVSWFDPSHRRRYHGLVLMLTSHIRAQTGFDPASQAVVDTYLRSRNVQAECERALGLTHAMPDEDYLAAVRVGNVALPRVMVHFLTQQDYVMRNYALFKANIALAIYSDISEQLDAVAPHTMPAAPTRRFSDATLQMITSFEPDWTWYDRRTARYVARITLASPRAAAQVCARARRDSPLLLLAVSEDAGGGVSLCRDVAFWRGVKDQDQDSAEILVNLTEKFRRAWTNTLSEQVQFVFVPRPASVAYSYTLACVDASLHSLRDTMPAWMQSLVLGTLDPQAAMRVAMALPPVPDAALTSLTLPGLVRWSSQALDWLRAHPDIADVTGDVDADSPVVCRVARRRALLLPQPSTGSQADIALYPAQQTAVLSCLLSRVTLLVGPPGTGKTDTATHMICALHAHVIARDADNGKMLIVAHSNHALDQLITSVASDSVPILRLGSGTTNQAAEALSCDAWLLRAQKDLAAARDTVTELLKDAPAAVLQRFRDAAAEADASALASVTPQLLQQVASDEQATATLTVCLSQLEHVLPLISAKRWERERVLVQRMPVVAVTCSGAAMKHGMLSEHVFSVVVMEEAGKVLETESFPLLLLPGVQRVVFIGDNDQLPPVVHDNTDSIDRLVGVADTGALKFHANYQQSMFQRWLRLGVRPVRLDWQGRAHPRIAQLYRWRYPDLKDLPAAVARARVPGLNGPVQLVDVSKPRSRGEVNDAEADYAAAIVDYLVAHGTPASAVAVLTPYRRQRDKLASLFPTQVYRNTPIVATTDEFQGLQSDVVILSLVTTSKSPSLHLRDQRRIIVMLSRARRALIIIGHASTFVSCPEWEPVIKSLPPQRSLMITRVDAVPPRWQPCRSLVDMIDIMPPPPPPSASSADDDEQIDDVAQALAGVDIKAI